MNSSIASGFNTQILEEKFHQWLDDPSQVDATWAAFFEGFSLGMSQSASITHDLPSPEIHNKNTSQSDEGLRVTLQILFFEQELLVYYIIIEL